MLTELQTGIAIAQRLHREKMAKKVYAEGEWWLPMQEVMKGWFLAVRVKTPTPAQVFLIRQTPEDVIYQRVIFKKFD